jgi:hypothetical protein
VACQCSLPSGLNEPNDLEGIFSAGTGTAPLRPSARQWILEPSREREQAARKQKGELCTLEGMSRERSVVPERARTKWISSAVRHCREAESSSAVVKLEQRSVSSFLEKIPCQGDFRKMYRARVGDVEGLLCKIDVAPLDVEDVVWIDFAHGSSNAPCVQDTVPKKRDCRMGCGKKRRSSHIATHTSFGK